MSKPFGPLGGVNMLPSMWSTVPIESLQRPPKSGLYSVKVNEWAAVDKNGDLLMFNGKVPQCNKDPRVIDAVYGNGKNPLYEKSVQVDLLFFPIKPGDY